MSFSLIHVLLLCALIVCSRGTPIVADSASNSSRSDSSEQGHARRGWVSQPDGRGTLDVLWSCSITIFLCSWSVLCLNVPGPTDTRYQVIRTKFLLTLLAGVGPEFIFQIALGQWISAHRSVKDFHSAKIHEWNLKQAFFADMGGFFLHTRDRTPFPIDAKQLLYLVRKDYITLPTIDARKIEDKNKVDGLLRTITLCQTLWFVINLSARAAQHLAITCLELTTAAFIVCSVGTTACWLDKPADVLTAEIIETSASVDEILEKAQEEFGDRARQPSSRTPLDFLSRQEWPWSIYWSNWINILRCMRIIPAKWIRPGDRFENTMAPEVPSPQVYFFLGLTAVYAAIFIAGWNYSFPTPVERTLWRAASLIMMSCLFTYWGSTELGFTLYPAARKYFARKTPTKKERKSGPDARDRAPHGLFIRALRYVAACMRNNSVSQDPALNVPLKAIIPIYVTGVFYCHARTYLLLADLIDLRSQPASAFATVNWSNFIPHY